MHPIQTLAALAAATIAIAAPTFAQSDRPEPAPTSQPADAATMIHINVDRAPSMAAYGERVQALAEQWFPKIEAMLPGDGYESPESVTIHFIDDMDGVAYASGGEVYCAATWFRERPEDIGAIVHELAHVVQKYPAGAPGWLVEGIADWVRFYHFEPPEARPQSDPNRARYDAAYRTSAQFLEWARSTYEPDLVVKLNAACRAGEYSEQLWIDFTGKPVETLGDEWKRSLR